MKHRSRWRFALEAIEGLALMPAAVWSWPLCKRWLDNWGATADERDGRWVGDALVPSADHTHTRAISIAAPADTVWGLMIQFGLGKAGFYSYELLERLVGIPVTNVESIEPSLQGLEVGDEVMLHPKAPGIPVAYLRAPHDICFGKQPDMARPTAEAADAADADDADDPARCWSLYIRPVTDSSCRLLSRSCLARPSTLAKRAALALEEPIDLVMEQRMLRTVKRLAEQIGPTRRSRSSDSTP